MKRIVRLLPLLFLACNLRGAPATRTVLVFPFENESARSDLGWISEGFAEILSSRLEGPNRYMLNRAERNEAYEQLGIPPGTPLTLASEYKVAETLGVDWALLGAFNVEANQLRARVQLLDVHALKLSAPLEARGELADLVDIQTRLAWRLLGSHAPDFTVGMEEEFSRRFPHVPLDAFENYIRGILATDRESQVHFLREADRLNPRDHRAAFELGQHYFDAKDYTNSAKWFRKLDHNDADYLESLFLIGVDEYFLGRDANAEKAFSALAPQIPLNEVWNDLGVMQSRRGRDAEALASFERAYQGDPTDADFCFNVSLCLWRLKRYHESARYLEEALKINAEDPSSHSLLASVFAKLGDREGEWRERRWLADHEGSAVTSSAEDEAILPQARIKKHYDGRAFRLLALMVGNALEGKLASEPDAQHADVHLSRGKKFLAEGRLPEAEHEVDEAASLQPQSSEPHLVLGQIYEAEGKHREAVREFEAALQIDNNAVTHLWLAHAYLSSNQPAAALDEGQAALKLQPGNADALRLIEGIRSAAGRRQKADGR